MTIFAPTGIGLVERRFSLRNRHGKVATTDGPYAEAKEQLGGILVLEARDMSHAVQLMTQHPAPKYHFRDSANGGPEPNDEGK
jgi:hypothetical protein